MAAGDKEVMQSFEEVTRRNVKTVILFSQETRRLVRELEEKVVHLEKVVLGQNKKLEESAKQLSLIQGKVYLNGTK